MVFLGAIFAVTGASYRSGVSSECMERAAVDIIGVKIPVEMFIVRYPYQRTSVVHCS